jgi:tetratricopeptide (TPR) repeat protein
MKYIFLLLLMGMQGVAATAQFTPRDLIRLGNKKYRQGDFAGSETYYRKSIDAKESMEAYYNLGNALVMQGQDSTANVAYGQALALSTDNASKKAMTYHNIGNLFYASGLKSMREGGQTATQALQLAVDNYKSALRLAPGDNETRYNLAMAQHLLKKSQNQDKLQKQNQQQKKDDQQQEQQKQQQQPQPQSQQNQADQKPQQKPKLDKQTADQLLNAAQNDEKRVQKRLQQQKGRPRTLDKDW